jgi:hypothetical protein
VQGQAAGDAGWMVHGGLLVFVDGNATRLQRVIM